MELSRSLSRRVFDDGISAYRNPDHPCHPFVRWQQSYANEKGGPELTFQLPEPFSGERSSLNLIFVGLNRALIRGKSSQPLLITLKTTTPFPLSGR